MTARSPEEGMDLSGQIPNLAGEPEAAAYGARAARSASRHRLRLLRGLATLAAVGALCSACGAPSEKTSSRRESALHFPADGSPAPSGTQIQPVRRESGLDVLLVTIDTLRADALGSYGNPRAATPLLDRLAAAGVRFDNARAHNVVTLPSHATILSGLHPHEHGVRDNSGFRFPAGIETLATMLAARGYRTGAFVSAFPLDARFGLDRGFEVYEDGFVDSSPRSAFLEPERPGTETVALAERWLAESDGKPSFAWVHLYEPHYPYAPPPPFDRRFADDPYLGDVAAADAALEPLLAPLLAAGVEGDSLVVVTSDHGEALGEHGEATHGIFAYESSLRVPLVVFQPRLLAPRVVTAPARLVDLLPTILDLLDAPIAQDLPGRSLAALGRGADEPVPTYFEALSGQLNRGWAPLFGIVEDGWKYIELPLPELYDLRADPRETRNLAAEESRRMEDLEARLAEYRGQDVGTEPRPEDRETRERLRALGYLGGTPETKRSYTVDDDPKRLIELDEDLREITGLHFVGDLEAARIRSRELLRRRPGMRVALMTLAQIERDLGNLDAAVAAMRRAFELQPDDTRTLSLLASYLTQAGRAEEAVELTEVDLGRQEPDVDVLLVRSLALARLGRPVEAADAIDRAREVDPGSPMVAVYAGTLYLMAGRRQEAREEFEHALDLAPRTVRAHTALAIMAGEEGMSAEAVEHWRRAVELDPREHAKLLATAIRMWSAGEQAAARPLLELFALSAPRDRYGTEIDRVRALLTTG